MTEKDIASLLYSYDDWKTVRKKTPYTFAVEKNRQSLYYFGANHSHDPKNEQFSLLREFWKGFLEKTGGKNAVVFVEGGLRKVAENEETAIEKDSEGGLVTLFAKKENVEVFCPEPNRAEEMDELLRNFSKDEISYYYFARNVHAWHRRDPKPIFAPYISKYLDKWEMEIWKDFDFSLENMKKIHKDIFDTEFDESNDDFFGDITKPIVTTTIINRVARACSTYRNVHVASEILKFWKEKKNIFVVFGGAHAIMQEPALRKLL